MRLFPVLLLLLPWATIPADAGDPGDMPTEDEIADSFRSEQVLGTIVVASLDGSSVYVYNDERARTRYSPASTFKVLNTLVGLNAGAVTSRDSRFEWDGSDRGVPAWNRDQTLTSAYRVSCVWCYQEIARSVGRDSYVSELQAVRYGNQQVGDQVDQFWLDGSLRVSAWEQIEFLGKLCSYSLPYSTAHIDELKAIMLEEQTSRYSLYGKTGWTGPGLYTGWYVGFVETGKETWLFAMNMRMDRVEQAPLRRQLVRQTLRILEII